MHTYRNIYAELHFEKDLQTQDEKEREKKKEKGEAHEEESQRAIGRVKV